MSKMSVKSEYEKYYLTNIPKGTLSKEYEELLARRIKSGDQKAKEEFIRYNLRLVIFVVQKYANITKIDIFDLIQEGNIALMEAVESFNPEIGRFSSYAIPCIRGAILSFINSKNLIHIPRNLQYDIINLKKGKREDDGNENLSKAMKMSTVAYLSAPVSVKTSKETGSTKELGDYIEDPRFKDFTNNIENKDLVEKLFKAAGLKKIEKEILELHFGLYEGKEYTLKEIGKMNNISTERVRQIKEKALKKLRSVVSKNYKDFMG